MMTPIAVEKDPTRRAALRGRISAFLEMDRIVKGMENIAIRLKRSKIGLTKLDLAVEFDLGGHVSTAAKLASVKHRLDEAGKLSVYFQRLVPLGDLVEEVRVREK